MTLHGQNLIGAQRSALGKAKLTATDPRSGEVLASRFHEASAEEIDAAVECAADAAPAYRRLTATARAAFLEAIAEQIGDLGDALLERTEQETGLPRARLTGERGRTIAQLRLFASLVREGSWVSARIDPALPERKPLPRPDLRRMLVPIGPVAVFGASNFPLAFSVAGGDTAAALAAGCPVVVKAHPAHPGTSELVAGAILAAAAATRMPDGVFSLLHGVSHPVGAGLVTHPRIAAVAFTGSFAGGRALFDLAAARPRPIPVYAEMGSVNPVFLLPGALAERGAAIADGLAGSVTMGAGQFCTNPGMTVLPRGAAAETFLQRLGANLAGAAPGTFVHAGIHHAFEAALAEASGLPGVELLARASGNGSHPDSCAAACLLRTDAAAWLQHERLAQEIYGPATIAVVAGDSAELLAVARRLDGHLTATVHGTAADLAAHGELLALLAERVGRLVFNGFPTGVEVSPAMQHGGPYPATTDSRSTSVGTAAIERFARPVCWQDAPLSALPEELQDGNPRGVWRLLDGQWTRQAVTSGGAGE